MKNLLNSEKLKTAITPELRQGFLVGLLFGGLIFLQLSELLEHRFDQIITLILMIIAPVFGIFILNKKK